MSETTIQQIAPRGMITIKGDLADGPFAEAIKAATGHAIPDQRRIVTGDTQLAWMAPDELLLITEHAAAPAIVADLETKLAGQHALVAEVSDARATFRISGPGAREVLAKGAPVDLSREAFQPGQIRRTRLGQVATAFWMTDDRTFELVCFRSVATYVEDWLTLAAEEGSLPEFF